MCIKDIYCIIYSTFGMASVLLSRVQAPPLASPASISLPVYLCSSVGYNYSRVNIWFITECDLEPEPLITTQIAVEKIV
jgi:hypothetical protein